MQRRAEERLLDAVTELAASDGYAQLTVERLLQAAGVSRATFYQYFSSAGDCFWSAYRHGADRLVSDLAASVSCAEHSLLALLDALLDIASDRPAMALLLMREPLSAGPTGLLERDALFCRIGQALGTAAPSACTVDLPIPILVGGACRFLAMRLGEGELAQELRGEMLEWARAFVRPPASRWSTGFTPGLPDVAPEAPRPPARAQHGGSRRERILRATAATIYGKGFGAATVADIVKAAGVSRRLFYNEFPSKTAVFIAAYEHAFEELMGACAPAFFSSSAWRQRIWDGALAATRFLSREPFLAYLGFVEGYALGPGFLPRVYGMQLAFTLFLEEGYGQPPQATTQWRISSGLTSFVVFEAEFQASRRGPGLHIPRMHPLVVYITLTPFIGSEEAGMFVTEKLAVQDAAVPQGA